MRTNSFKFLFVYFLLFSITGSALTYVENPPSDTVKLCLSAEESKNWKEIHRSITETRGIVEFIPASQTPFDWFELIAIQYVDRSAWGKKGSSIKKVMSSLKKTIVKAYPKKKVTWRILEESDHDVIYEWILHSPHHNIPPQHEIARAFFVGDKFQRIGFTRQYKEMDAPERERWIKLLKENVRMVSIAKALRDGQGLSIADKYRDSLDFGAFADWKQVSRYTFDNGLTMTAKAPPSSLKNIPLTINLEVTTIPNFNGSTLAKYVAIEKNMVQEKTGEKINFKTINDSQSDITYSYTYALEELQLTGVVRTFLYDNGFYSISYKEALPKILPDEEILKRKELLDTIKVRGVSGIDIVKS